MKRPTEHLSKPALSDAAIDDLKDVMDATGLDSTAFDREALNNIGNLLLTAHIAALKVRSRAMQEKQKDGIIDP